MQLLAEGTQFVVQCPQRLAPFRSRQHVFRASLGDRILQQGEDRHQFRGGLHIQIVHREGGDDALRIVADGLAHLAQGDEYLHAIIVQISTGFEGRGITAGGLQITVVLLLPFVYLGELSGDGVLQQGGLGLPLDLLLYLAVDGFVALCQCHPFHGIGGDQLRPRFLSDAYAQDDGCYGGLNDS